MTFRDLKLPKELSKKKKLELYKCWILTPLDKGSDTRVLNLNTDCDRYGLTAKAAVEIELNQNYKDKIYELSMDDLLAYFESMCFVIMKVTLATGSMDEEVIIPPENKGDMDIDPHYDPENMILNATIQGRISDVEIKNYSLIKLQFKIDDNTGIIHVADLDLQEQIVNHVVTGGK